MKNKIGLLAISLMTLATSAMAQTSTDLSTAAAAAEDSVQSVFTTVGPIMLGLAGAGLVYKVGRSWIRKLS
jgi:hypothetical protein